MLISILIVLAAVAADQAVKYWASAVLSHVDTIPVIADVFHLTYAENRGAAFSILQGRRVFFVIITVVLLAVLVVLLKKGYARHWLGRLGILFVIAGAVGNLIDRIRLGYVVDMFDFRLINFAIFNVADALITVGGVMYIIYFLFMDEKIRKRQLGGEEPHEQAH